MAVFDQESRRKVYVLNLERYGGLGVSVRKPSFHGVELLAGVVAVLGDQLDSTARPIAERVAAWGRLIEAFADSLISWELLDQGRAVPATLAGVRAQDHLFLLDLTQVWYRRVVLLRESTPEPPAEVEDTDSAASVLDALEEELAGLPVTVLDPTGDEPEMAEATSGQ